VFAKYPEAIEKSTQNGSEISQLDNQNRQKDED
jgi:hypothetical protein